MKNLAQQFFYSSYFFENRFYHYIFISIFLLYLIFLPTLNILHYSGDDFKYSFGATYKSCAENDGYHFMLSVGRPLQAMVDCLGFKFGYTLFGMKIMRIFTVIAMGIVMGLLVDWFCILGFTLPIAFFAAGNLVLIEHMYGDAIPMAAISLPLAVLFAIIAYRFMHAAHSMTQRIWLWRVLAFLVLLAALLTYPALAFFYVTLMLSKCLFAQQNYPCPGKMRKELFRELVLFSLTCGIYFIWAAYNIRYHLRTEVPPSYHVGQPNLNIFEMIRRLILLGNLFSSWWPLSPLNNLLIQGWAIIISISGGLLFMLVRVVKNFQSKKKFVFVEQSFVGLSLVILSGAFFLVMPNLDIVENRILFSIITSVLLVSYWGWCQVIKILPFKFENHLLLAALVLLFLTLSYQASTVTMVNAMSHVEYLNSTKLALSSYLDSGKIPRRIHFVIPESNSPYDRYPLANSALSQLINKKSYSLHWCAESRTAGVCLSHLKPNGIAVTYSIDQDIFPQTQNMVVIQNHFKSLSLNQL